MVSGGTFYANPITSNPQQTPEIALKTPKSTRIENDKNKQERKVHSTNVKTQKAIFSALSIEYFDIILIPFVSQTGQKCKYILVRREQVLERRKI